MNTPVLITFESAAALLQISEPDLYDLIDAGKLTTHRSQGDIFLNATEITALTNSKQLSDLTSQSPTARTTESQGVNENENEDDSRPRTSTSTIYPPTRTPTYPPDSLSRIRALRASGVKEVSAAVAGDLLGIGSRQIQHLMHEGRLNSEKRGRHRYIDIMEVEFYAMDQAHWSTKAGRWTAYGKQEKPDPHAGLLLLAAARGKKPTERMTESPNDQTTQRPAPDYLLLTKHAATILNVCEGYCRHLCRKHGIKPVRVKRDTGRLNALGKRHVAAPAAYSARAIYALAEKLEAKRNRGNLTPRQWRDLPARPIIRTKIEPPPNDALITAVEAAAILQVSKTVIRDLVGKGRLFAWQRIPGRPGIPLYLSFNQVSRYARDPQRLKRREAHLSRRGPREPSPPGQETNQEIWREDVGLGAGIGGGRNTTVDHEHGEYFNTSQVAKLLGVSRSAVDTLRKRGRLSAYQKPRQKWDGGGNKWYFYKKDEVYDLLADGDYLRRRDRSRRAKLLSLGREVPSMETEW